MLLWGHSVSKSFTEGETEKGGVKDISMMCLKGKTISVVGLNGAGKSVLLSLLGGLFPPSKGYLYKKDKTIRSAYFSRLSDCPSYSIEHHHKLMKLYHNIKGNERDSKFY